MGLKTAMVFLVLCVSCRQDAEEVRAQEAVVDNLERVSLDQNGVVGLEELALNQNSYQNKIIERTIPCSRPQLLLGGPFRTPGAGLAKSPYRYKMTCCWEQEVDTSDDEVWGQAVVLLVGDKDLAFLKQKRVSSSLGPKVRNEKCADAWYRKIPLQILLAEWKETLRPPYALSPKVVFKIVRLGGYPNPQQGNKRNRDRNRGRR
ncbi:MAG: hypothetical protein JRF33_01275 [Deltaproteobacteria bacterium]|nr:hypothetical protein [Deltaproteobacteria bacterium]